jgi:hypothetical protein
VHVTIAMLEPEEVFALWWLFAKDTKENKKKIVGTSDVQYSINYGGILHFL